MATDLVTLSFAATRAIHLIACLTVLGVWMFDRIILTNVDRDWQKVPRRFALIFLPVALISGIAWFGFVAIAMSGLPPSEALKSAVLGKVFWQTYFGEVWKWRSIFWGWSAIALCARTTHSVRAWVSIVAGILLVASLAFSGHGQTGSAPALHVCADMVHLLIASIWPVGLLPLLIALWHFKSQPTVVAELVRRFSSIALIAVISLTISGLVNAWCLIGSFEALMSSNYGRTLIVKIALFTLMLILGSWNRFILKPRLRFSTIRTNVAVELGFGVIVLILTGLLGLLPPPRM